MRQRMKTALCLLSLLCLSVSTVTAADLPVLADRDVFELSYASTPIVTQAGDKVFYLKHSMDIMTDRNLKHLWWADIATGELRPITAGDMTASSPALAPDDNRIAFVSKDATGAQIFFHWLDTGRTVAMTRLPETPSRFSWSPDGQWLAFTMHVATKPPTMGTLPTKPEGAKWAEPPVVVDRMIYRRDGRGNRRHGFEQVFVMPASGGSPRQLTSGDYDHTSQIAWSADSKAVFVSVNRDPDRDLEVVNTDIFRIELDDGRISRLTTRKGPDNHPTVSPDGKYIAYLGWDDQKMGYHRTRLYVMGTDGREQRELLAELDRDIAQPHWSADGQKIFFQYDDLGDTVLAVTDLSGQMTDLVRGLGGKSLGRPYAAADIAVGGNDVYAYTSGTTESPADISVGQLGSDSQRRLTNLNGNLLPFRSLATVESRWIKSTADGRDIQAWVVKPPEFDPAKKYPLLLEIHGGPFTNYGFRFSTEIQLYAAAGYVVVYVNPRGSTSYGEAFGNLIHHAYPSKDYDDLISAVDAVIAEGYIDEKQLYVTGGSGGGVLTAWIVGKTDRFRAAVVAKPVINWTSFVLYADNSPYFSRYWFEKMPWEDQASYWQRSPLSLVGNVSTPTMLLTGEADLRTPMAETEQYYQALKLRGVDTAMVRMPGAYHGIAARPSQLIGKVNAILDWFQRHAGD